ncbi:MAG: response regulator [Cyclobacteriaceae bacterium]
MDKLIMVVEDTADLLAGIQELLQMEGYQVSAVRNGVRALKLLPMARPDLIITDLLMPEMNGFDLIRKVREETMWDAIPILVFSAMPAQENERIVFDLGANSYLKKPGTVEALLVAVNKLLIK